MSPTPPQTCTRRYLPVTVEMSTQTLWRSLEQTNTSQSLPAQVQCPRMQFACDRWCPARSQARPATTTHFLTHANSSAKDAFSSGSRSRRTMQQKPWEGRAPGGARRRSRTRTRRSSGPRRRCGAGGAGRAAAAGRRARAPPACAPATWPACMQGSGMMSVQDPDSSPPTQAPRSSTLFHAKQLDTLHCKHPSAWQRTRRAAVLQHVDA